MITQFQSILEPLKHPKVKIVNRPFKKQNQLFEPDDDIEVQFNGYNTLSEHQEEINRCFLRSKAIIDDNMSSQMDEPLQVKQKLHLLKFEVRSFRKSYFSLTNDELILSRIEIHKNSLPVRNYHPLVKKKSSNTSQLNTTS